MEHVHEPIPASSDEPGQAASGPVATWDRACSEFQRFGVRLASILACCAFFVLPVVLLLGWFSLHNFDGKTFKQALDIIWIVSMTLFMVYVMGFAAFEVLRRLPGGGIFMESVCAALRSVCCLTMESVVIFMESVCAALRSVCTALFECLNGAHSRLAAMCCGNPGEGGPTSEGRWPCPIPVLTIVLYLGVGLLSFSLPDHVDPLVFIYMAFMLSIVSCLQGCSCLSRRPSLSTIFVCFVIAIASYCARLVVNRNEVSGLSVDKDFPLAVNTQPAPGKCEVTALFQRPVQRLVNNQRCGYGKYKRGCRDDYDTACFDDYMYVCSWNGSPETSRPSMITAVPRDAWIWDGCRGACDRWGGWKAAPAHPKDQLSHTVYANSVILGGGSVRRWDGHCDHNRDIEIEGAFARIPLDEEAIYRSHEALSSIGVAKEPLYLAVDPYGDWRLRGKAPIMHLGARLELRFPAGQVPRVLCPDRTYNPLCAQAGPTIHKYLDARERNTFTSLNVYLFALMCCVMCCVCGICRSMTASGSMTLTIR